jgi:membrane associated rhomboid family serine protease
MIPLRDTIRSRHFPIMTWLLVGVNTVVFLFQINLNPAALTQLVDNFAIIPARWANDSLWFIVTLFTSLFMHGGWFHFLSNMWTLFIFGDNVEDRMGPRGYLSFYLLSGLAAGLLQTFTQPFSMIPVIGASGAIAGVLGAYLLLFPRSKIVTLVPIIFIFTTVNIPAGFYLGFWFFLQLFSGLSTIGASMGGVAWWAHVGGFLFGFIMCRFFLWRPKPQSQVWTPYQVIDLPPDDPFRR